MSEPGQILVVVTVAHGGGAQFAALRLARGLRDRGHSPRVVFLYAQSEISGPDHPYEVLLPTPRPGALGYLRIAQRLFRLVRNEKPAVVLTFLPLAATLGQASARLNGIGRRVISHRNPVSTISPLLRSLDRLWAWLGFYSGVVAVSDGVRQTCGGYPAWLRRRTVVVHNGIRDWQPSCLTRAEARRQFAVAEDAFVLVAVGRLAAQKNYFLLLQVMERLPGVKLLIAGDGPLRSEIEAEISRCDLQDRVTLLGEVGRAYIPDLLAAADLFVQTSTYEGQSNSVLEALYAGVPCVVHDIPEQRETVAETDGTAAGALVPLNDVDGWVAAIERLRDNPPAAAAARTVAARRAALFSYDAMITGFENVLSVRSP